jgi:hypothetical protein
VAVWIGINIKKDLICIGHEWGDGDDNRDGGHQNLAVGDTRSDRIIALLPRRVGQLARQPAGSVWQPPSMIAKNNLFQVLGKSNARKFDGAPCLLSLYNIQFQTMNSSRVLLYVQQPIPKCSYHRVD